MIFHLDDLLLFPLSFGVMVLQKTYGVSRSALIPTVVNSKTELVEANSKLGLISGAIGALGRRAGGRVGGALAEVVADVRRGDVRMRRHLRHPVAAAARSPSRRYPPSGSSCATPHFVRPQWP